MDKLVTGMIERNDPITEPILRQHWAVYAHQFGVDDPKRLHSFSHGWLSQFKNDMESIRSQKWFSKKYNKWCTQR